MHGTSGILRWTPLAGQYAGMRHLRFADGSDKVHHMVVGRAEIQKYWLCQKMATVAGSVQDRWVIDAMIPHCMRVSVLGKKAGIAEGKVIINMRKRLTGFTLTILCSVFAPVAFADPDISVDKFCSRVTVDGIAGQIWRTTENGITTWAILDANRQYLADAPARCIELLGEMMLRQELRAAPSIRPIPATGDPTPTPIVPSDTGASHKK